MVTGKRLLKEQVMCLGKQVNPKQELLKQTDE